jgi:hypothetical protein
MRGSRRLVALIALCPLLTWLALGCADEKPAESPAPAHSRTIERGPLTMTAVATPDQPHAGDEIRFTLAVTGPAGLTVEFPPPEALAPLTVREVQTVENPPAGPGLTARAQLYVVEAWPVGDLTVPELPVRYALPDDAPAASESESSAPATSRPAVEWMSPSLTIPVASVLTDHDSVENPREITGLLAVPPRKLTPLEWALLIGAAIALLAAAAMLIRAIIRWRNRPPPPLTPEEWAYAALDHLRAKFQSALSADALRQYYYELSEIVRAYVERRFGLRAPEMTTEEFLRVVAQRRDSAVPYASPLPPGGLIRLRPFLEACDLVKYAALSPLPADADRAWQEARRFVEDSTPSEALRAGRPEAA